jgi:Carbohydrate family 9 binding domain-like
VHVQTRADSVESCAKAGALTLRLKPAALSVFSISTISIALFGPAAQPSDQTPKPQPDFERLPYSPRRTIVYRAPSRPTVDGKLDERGWRAAPWSEPFVDIEGDIRPRPPLATRAAMLWDDEALYVAAELEEPDVWGTLTERDAIIFHDNDFEIFLDPDGDTHAYYELEVNALATPWDLLLVQPYRDGGPAIHAWDIAGLQVAVEVRGTINRPGDHDEGWSVELALPWMVLKEAAPGRRAPRAGDQWRVNFSRVQWRTEATDGRYVKPLDPRTGKPFPEDNWVWSPQGAIDMHMPERWGVMQFSDLAAGAGTATFVEDGNNRVKWALRRLYYRQRRFRAVHGRYASDLAQLDARSITVEGMSFRPSMEATPTQYEITAGGAGNTRVHLRQDGRVWVTGP